MHLTDDQLKPGCEDLDLAHGPTRLLAAALYWRNQAVNAKAGARYTADLCTQALDEVRRLHLTRIALTHIAEAAEDHPAYMGYGRSNEDLEKEGGDAAKITEIAYTARAALAQIGEQA